jgi:beta-galactosidase GanA
MDCGEFSQMKNLFAVATVALGLATSAITAPLPHIVSNGGKHEFVVDGSPFLMLGAQVHNSSNYPAMLPQVWPVIHQLGANTVEVPVAWQQLEPQEGKFDFSWLDTLLVQARQNDVRLVLLWFGTAKNTGPAYTPEWVKGDTKRFPRMMTKDGKTHYVLTPLARSTLEADKRAFVALMTRLRETDPQHTVIMVQPENETGTYDSPRDFSPEANRLFAGPIPAELARRVGKSGNWTQAFGKGAERAFTAWYIARYVDEIAAAGQSVLNLPMYVNASLGDPFTDTGAGNGGPDWPVLDIWKAGAPHIAIEAPDIYHRDEKGYVAILDHFARADNPLFVPETGNDKDHARFLWAVLGKGGIGFSPFGMDSTGYTNFPLGAPVLNQEVIEAFAAKYRLLRPIASEWARLAFEHPTWGSAKPDDGSDRSGVLGRWKITTEYGRWPFGEPQWLPKDAPPPPSKDQPVGGAAVIQLGPDEFLLVGSDVRVRFGLDKPGGENSQFLDVEEGTFVNGQWVMKRRWNGDQTDYGLNLQAPTLLKVRMGTYR